MDVAKIKAILLASVGNPDSGAIADYADVMAHSVVNECKCDKDCCKEEVKSYNPVSETRVIKKSSETR